MENQKNEVPKNVEPKVETNNQQKPKTSARTLSIVALVVGFFIPLVGWICGYLGYKKAKAENDQTSATISMVGITLASVVFLIACVLQSYFNFF